MATTSKAATVQAVAGPHCSTAWNAVLVTALLAAAGWQSGHAKLRRPSCHSSSLQQLHQLVLQQQRVSDPNGGAAAWLWPHWLHDSGPLLQVAASLDGGGLVEVFPPPFAGLARRSDFPHAWGLAHMLPCTSCTGAPPACTGVARQHFHGGASCPSL